jgi:putative hydrolase of the HAD superfamily
MQTSPAMPATRAISLDALGTLVTFEPPVERLVALVAARHGIAVTRDDARRALRAEMAHYRGNCIRAADDASLAELRLECAALLAAELGGESAALEPAEILPTLLDSLRFVAYPEVAAALGRWREAGWRLVVASNWDVSLHDVLDRTGLRPLLDGVVTSAEVGASKPAPQLFAAALALAGAEPAATIHVGDSLAEDVDGARAAGLEAVWLDRKATGEPPPGVRSIASLDQLELPR